MTETFDVEVVETHEALAPVNDYTLVALAEQAEKRVDALVKIKRAALKSTNPKDWTNQNGNPYLQVSGAEKVGRIFGISWRIDEPVKENLEGGHFSYTYKGYFSLAGATIEAIGTRSSKDGFFKRYSWNQGEKTELPPSEIDAGDVKKAAYTNCIGNGVTRLLGIRNLTWEDLHEFAGITQEQVSGVDYKKDGKKQEAITSEGAVTVTVNVTDVRKKEGKTKQGKEFTKYTVKTDDNNEYGTFSETVAKLAKEAKEGAIPVVITYKPSQFGNDIETLKLKEEPTQERLPGQEG